MRPSIFILGLIGKGLASGLAPSGSEGLFSLPNWAEFRPFPEAGE